MQNAQRGEQRRCRVQSAEQSRCQQAQSCDPAAAKLYFRDVEDIMTAHGGRPHWGKMHTRDADYRASLSLVESAVRRAWASPRRDLLTCPRDPAAVPRRPRWRILGGS